MRIFDVKMLIFCIFARIFEQNMRFLGLIYKKKGVYKIEAAE